MSGSHHVDTLDLMRQLVVELAKGSAAREGRIAELMLAAFIHEDGKYILKANMDNLLKDAGVTADHVKTLRKIFHNDDKEKIFIEVGFSFDNLDDFYGCARDAIKLAQNQSQRIEAAPASSAQRIQDRMKAPDINLREVVKNLKNEIEKRNPDPVRVVWFVHQCFSFISDPNALHKSFQLGPAAQSYIRLNNFTDNEINTMKFILDKSNQALADLFQNDVGMFKELADEFINVATNKIKLGTVDEEVIEEDSDELESADSVSDIDREESLIDSENNGFMDFDEDLAEEFDNLTKDDNSRTLSARFQSSSFFSGSNDRKSGEIKSPRLLINGSENDEWRSWSYDSRDAAERNSDLEAVEAMPWLHAYLASFNDNIKNKNFSDSDLIALFTVICASGKNNNYYIVEEIDKDMTEFLGRNDKQVIDEQLERLNDDVELKKCLERGIALLQKGLVYMPDKEGQAFHEAIARAVNDPSMQDGVGFDIETILKKLQRPIVLISKFGEKAVNLDEKNDYQGKDPVLIYDRGKGKFDALLVAPGADMKKVLENIKQQIAIGSEVEPGSRPRSTKF